MTAKVYLVGAGPGDPVLITEKAKQVIQEAEVIVYDSLINPVLLQLNVNNAEIIYVGKRRGKRKYEQHEINQLIIAKAREGRTVARLKGGDPFVFGRGGEEGQALRRNNIEYEIVPGVSSVTAVPAYAGIPLTHRNYNSSFTVITGHEDPDRNETRIDWESVSKMETLVFLMSLNNTERIMDKLLENRMDPGTPVSITSHGTTPLQRTITGTISDISRLLKNSPQIKTPAVTVVGNVVKLRDELSWFENRPLFGKKILVTRPAAQSANFYRHLLSAGAEVVEFPTIEISEPDSWAEVDEALQNFSSYDHVIFTSVNGVNSFFRRLEDRQMDSRSFAGKTLTTIGAKTASELKKFGLKTDLMPQEYVAEGIIEVLERTGVSGNRILIPRAEMARDVLPVKLKEQGAEVDIVTCYKTVVPEHNKAETDNIKKMLVAGEIDVVTFTSSSTVDNFFSIFGRTNSDSDKYRIACIGPVTADRVSYYKLNPDIVADEYTVEGLTQKIISYFKRESLSTPDPL